jgi:heme A synthase
MAVSYNRFLHWFAVLTAAVGFLPVISTTRTTLFGPAVGFLSLIMTIWIWRADRGHGTKIVASLALGGAILEGVFGPFLSANSKLLGFVEACLALMVFALLVSVAILTSNSWHRGVQTVLDDGWPSLSSLSRTCAGLVLVDSVLGAAFRHQLLGPVLHIAGAMAGMVVVVMLCIFVLTQHSGHESLRQSSLTLLLATSGQMLLGIADYMARLWSLKAASQNWGTSVLGPLHSALGALTLAAATAVVIQVSRNVRKSAALPLSSPHSLGAI